MILKFFRKIKQAKIILEGLIPADEEMYFNDLVIKQCSIVTELDRKSVNKVENQENRIKYMRRFII